jgi:hypothetical protein
MPLIKRVGVELEGGWDELPDRERLVRDGSVTIHNADYQGELRSPPSMRRDLPGWIRRCYPSAVNATCGFHIHLSFKTLGAYMRLMDVVFRHDLLQALCEWGERERIPLGHAFWMRLQGENTYCRVEPTGEQFQRGFRPNNHQEEERWDPDLQATCPHHYRYHMLNFCYAEHGTLEVRVLPMFEDVEQGLSALEVVLDTTEAFLKLKRREAPLRVAATLEEGDPLEERVEEEIKAADEEVVDLLRAPTITHDRDGAFRLIPVMHRRPGAALFMERLVEVIEPVPEVIHL